MEVGALISFSPEQRMFIAISGMINLASSHSKVNS